MKTLYDKRFLLAYIFGLLFLFNIAAIYAVAVDNKLTITDGDDKAITVNNFTQSHAYKPKSNTVIFEYQGASITCYIANLQSSKNRPTLTVQTDSRFKADGINCFYVVPSKVGTSRPVCSPVIQCPGYTGR